MGDFGGIFTLRYADKRQEISLLCEDKERNGMKKGGNRGIDNIGRYL